MKKFANLTLLIVLAACFVFQPIQCLAIDDNGCYLNTQIPIFHNIGSVSDGREHTVFNNHITYWYDDVSEEDFHNYRHKLENNGFTLYDTVNNSDYFVDYTDDLYGITVRYNRDLPYTSERVYVCYQSKLNRISIQVCDTEGLYDVVTASDSISFYPGCTDALLYYRCGYYQDAMDCLNNFVQMDKEQGYSSPAFTLTPKEGEFFNKLYADTEYALKYSNAIYDWIDKIINYYDNGLYYEALAEIGWLKQTYKLPPSELGYVQWLERTTNEALNEYQFYDGLTKAINYYNKRMYTEARDELRWIKNIPTKNQDYIDAYNMLIDALY